MKEVIKRWIQFWARQRSYKAAVKEAKDKRAQTFKKYHVIFLGGEFRAVSRQRLKQLHAEGAFKKGISMQDLNKLIYYTTH